MAKNTIFSVNPDTVAQLTGTGKGHPGYNGPATIGAGVAPVYAATIDLAPFLANGSRFISITTTAVGASTVSTAFVAPAGAILHIMVTQYSGGSAAVTFGTGFRSAGTVTPTTVQSIITSFVSDGTNWCESAVRSGSLA